MSTYSTTTGRMQGKSYPDLQGAKRHPPDPGLDAKGRMRLDVTREWMREGHFFTVRVKTLSGSGIMGLWEFVERTPMPPGMTRTEVSQAQRAVADLAALKLGHPYRLRSRL